MKLFMNILAVMLVFSAVAALPEPYAGWDMNAISEDRKVVDVTGGGRDMTLGDGVTLCEDADFGKVLRWEGTRGSWGAFQNIALEDRTISIWFYRDELDADLDTANNNKIPYLLNSWSDMLVNFSKGTSGFNLTLGGVTMYNITIPSRERWHQMTIAYRKTGYADEEEKIIIGELTSYLNGALQRTFAVTNTKPFSVSGTTIIGNNTTSPSNADPRPFKGMISKIRVYSEAFDAADVRTAYLNELDTFGNRLVGCWSLGECETSESGKTTYISQGDALAALEKGSSAQIVYDPVMGRNVSEFPNCSLGSYAMMSLPKETKSFSFGVYLNFPTNLIELSQVGSLDDSTKTNTMPNVYYFGAYSRLCIDGSYRQKNYTGGHFFDVGTLDNSGDQGFQAPVVTTQKGRWGHLGITYEISYDEGKAQYAMTPRIYVDGTCVQTGDTQCAAGLSDVIAKDTKFFLGTGSTAAPRSFCGRIADFTVYNSLLNEESMAELARGMPRVDAGADFVLKRGVSARLNGSVSSFGTMGNSRAAATTLHWSLSSCPQGGEAAVLKMADSKNPIIVLPVAGEYVFRLTARSPLLKLAVSDEVKVVCEEKYENNTPPVITIAGEDSIGLRLPLELTASVSDADSDALSVRWKILSGPGALCFTPSVGFTTKALFYAAGEYRVAAVAFDGQSETQSAPLEVTVVDSGDVNLESGLIAHWPFDSSMQEVITKTKCANIDRIVTSFEKGVDGYGVRSYSAFYPYVNTQMTLQETTSDTTYSMPDERYRAFSLWMYHEPSDTNNSKCATLVSVPYTLGLWYNCEEGKNGFSLYQQILGGTASGFGNVDEYAMPSVNPEGKWTHVYALFDRTTGYKSNTSELWIDGVKMSNRIKHGMGGGRVRTGTDGYIMIGGHKKNGDNDNGHFKDAEGNYYSRTFPGVIDEVRMYNRKLTEAEIKYLAANPVVDVNMPPVAGAYAKSATAISRRALEIVGMKANGDLTGAELSGSWEVLEGEGVIFGKNDLGEDTFTAKKAGVYSIVYVVSDGVNTTYSEPIEIVVERAGMSLILK